MGSSCIVEASIPNQDPINNLHGTRILIRAGTKFWEGSDPHIIVDAPIRIQNPINNI